MEQPFYGRTGLLVNTERAGLPVRHRRLHNIATPASAPLRWRPTLLTVPQKLLVAIREGEAHDCAYRERASLGVALRAFVRVGLMVDTLARTVGCLHGPHSAAAHSYAQLSQRVLQWWSNPEQARWMHECGARQRKSEYGVGKDHDMLSSWFIPCYDLAVMTRPHSGSNSNSSSSSNTISSDSVGHNAAAAAPVTQGQSRVVGRLRAVSQRALTLFGKDKAVNDVPIDHDSCSGQHAAMFVQFSFAPEDELLSVCEDALIKYRMTEETVSVSTGTIGQAEASVGDVDGAVDDRSSGKNKAWSKDEFGPPTRSHAAERRVAQNRESCRIDDSCVAFICTRLLHAVEQLEQEACQSSADGDGFAALWSLELLLMDLQSTNGTYVNGERLKPWTPWKLIEGDVVRFAYIPLTYLVVRPEQG